MYVCTQTFIRKGVGRRAQVNIFDEVMLEPKINRLRMYVWMCVRMNDH